jgi:hypothetical protein
LKVTIKVELTANSVENTQKTLIELLDGERQKGTISTYSFEIEGPAGIITERCVLSEGKVIA